ncbi:MAG: class I SAM-dependent methyltransferase [Candidatus Omnitrophica bacterium]|nr:class I SAM-dependent methyltransferase [Candidatus Omnitrophota bacterium]
MPQVDYEKRNVHPERLEAIRKYAGRSVLDVGCGNGAYVLKLAGEYDMKGVDARPYGPWTGKPSHFSTYDGFHLNEPDQSVDTILCFEVLEHLEDPFRILKECYRVCRKNVILTVPNCDVTPAMEKSFMVYSHWIDRSHRHFYEMRSITAQVEEAGFRVAASRYINKVSLMPLMLEMLGLNGSGAWVRAASKFFSIFQKKPYFLTCLVVGEKRSFV